MVLTVTMLGFVMKGENSRRGAPEAMKTLRPGGLLKRRLERKAEAETGRIVKFRALKLLVKNVDSRNQRLSSSTRDEGSICQKTCWSDSGWVWATACLKTWVTSVKPIQNADSRATSPETDSVGLGLGPGIWICAFPLASSMLQTQVVPIVRLSRFTSNLSLATVTAVEAPVNEVWMTLLKVL